jgi:hypothetical protein
MGGRVSIEPSFHELRQRLFVFSNIATVFYGGQPFPKYPLSIFLGSFDRLTDEPALASAVWWRVVPNLPGSFGSLSDTSVHNGLSFLS